MKRFRFQPSTFFGYETVILTDSTTNNSVEIALRGANVLNYKINKDGNVINIIDGFQTLEEFEPGSGARNFIMAPYSNKIKNNEYEFKGVKYNLDAENTGNSMRHGLVSKVEFEIYSVNLFDDSIEISFYTEKLRKRNSKGYPFDVNVFVKYIFYGNCLKVEIKGTNIGDKPAPFGAGWHSYFKTTETGIDHLQLELNANKIILIDESQVPLEGAAAYDDLDNHPGIDFRSARPVDKRQFNSVPVNVCFTELTEKKNDFYETILNDPVNNIELNVFQQSGVTYVFTGDGLAFRPRKSVAIEPVEFMTDSYNRAECLDQLELKPGKSKSFTFGVKVKY